MNVLFLTLSKCWFKEESDIYMDMMKEISNKGNQVYIVSPIEKKEKKEDFIKKENNVTIINVNIGNYFNTNFFEKGITLLKLERDYWRGINKILSDIKIDLILYSTPPITFNKIIKRLKEKNNALTYLLLKDIFPQNAVDLNILKKKGIRSLMYHYFRKKEKKLYEISDYIGCMSQANKEYIEKHNSEIPKDKIELCPNSIMIREIKKIDREKIRKKYRLPQNKIIFVYGGNLGMPQGPKFILRCLEENEKNKDTYILIIGKGSEYETFKKWFDKNQPQNSRMIEYLPQEDYIDVMLSCDVGLIFLDYRFTIPNFPSRILNYMEGKLPILAATDKNTDIGKVIEDNECGFWCESRDVKIFMKLMKKFTNAIDRKMMGKNSFECLKNNFDVVDSCNVILKKVKKGHK